MPFAGRQNTMMLDTVRPEDVPLGHVYPQKDEDLSLKTNDIYKAQPFYRYKQLEVLGQKPPPEPGQKTKTLYPRDLRRPRDLSLTTGDIELARPQRQPIKGNRHVDPVCPEYKLPTYAENREPTPRRWNGRHTNDISDIEYTAPKIRIPDRNYDRDPNDGSDIAYSKPNYKRRVLRPINARLSNSLDVRDINHDPDTNKVPFKERNPLDPEYTISQSTTTSLYNVWSEENSNPLLKVSKSAPKLIGCVAGSKPRKLQWRNGEPQLSLVKEDIAGAYPQRWIGQVPYNLYDPPEKKPVITFHDPFDIVGAQVGSLAKGIRTHRSLYPLEPAYKLLDGQQTDAYPHRPEHIPSVMTGIGGAKGRTQEMKNSTSNSVATLAPATAAMQLDKFQD